MTRHDSFPWLGWTLPFVIISFLGLPGCSPKVQETAVARIGETPVTIADFEKMYTKSNGSREAGVAASQEDRERFLDLMIKYRLKLTDAYQQHLDRRSDVTAEIEQYKGSLAASYLTEHNLVTPNVQRMYDRMGEEVRVIHILLTFKQDATAEDSASVYKQAEDIIAQAKAGTDFVKLTDTYSQDPTVKNNHGDYYYFTSGRMVPEFEDAAFALKKGEISPKPIRTQYGLHIIKMLDRKPTSGEIRCSHIMTMFPPQNPSPEDTLAAYTKIKAVQDSVALGGDFGELAIRNSGDGGSSGRGGDLGWFSRNRWPQPFDEAAFLLKPGQVSGIVRTIYGYHLIKCMEARPRKSFEESKADLQRTYQQQRFQPEYNAMYAHIQKEVGYVRHDSIRDVFLSRLDSTKTIKDSAWAAEIPTSLARSAMLTVAAKPVTVDTIVAMLKSRPDLAGTSLHRVSMTAALDKIIEQLVFAAKANLLEQTDLEFASILKEYREGILLYQIEQEQVWNRVSANDSLSRLYFADHRAKFTFPDRVHYTALRASNESDAYLIHNQLIQGTTIEQFVREDSARLAAPSAYQMKLAPAKAVLPGGIQETVAPIVRELQKDLRIRVQVSAYPDTAKNKAKNEKLANQRVALVRGYITGAAGVDAERVFVQMKPRSFIPTKRGQKDTTGLSDLLELSIFGRQSLMLPPVDTALVAPASDERAQRADSLTIGGISKPFFSKGSYSIVRLNRREPARQKTFEEAGPEVASAFQDFEAKRLESTWLDRVRQKHPVVEFKEELKNAFVPVK
jgi:peptidyl-prolyl cis-trans isomerase SurA